MSPVLMDLRPCRTVPALRYKRHKIRSHGSGYLTHIIKRTNHFVTI